MFTYVELNDANDNNRRTLAPVTGHGLIIEESSNRGAIISAFHQPDRAITAPSYEAIRVAMFAAGMALDCTLGEADLTASLLSDGEAKRNVAANAITDAEEDLRLEERNAELAETKEQLAEFIAIKGHLLRLAPIDERFCHMSPADAVSELMRLWEMQTGLIRQFQSDARRDASLKRSSDETIIKYADEVSQLKLELAKLNQELAYEREQRFGKAALKSEGEAS